jgi:hypothetical protein
VTAKRQPQWSEKTSICGQERNGGAKRQVAPPRSSCSIERKGRQCLTQIFYCHKTQTRKSTTETASIPRTIDVLYVRKECLPPGEADWGGHFRSRNIAMLVGIRRKCTDHILKLSDTRRRSLAASERTSKSNLYDNNTRKFQDNGHLSMTRSLSI